MPKVKFKTRVRYRSSFAVYKMRVEKKCRTVLYRLGGYVRTTMQRSMPISKVGKSRGTIPGKPPLGHRGSGGGLRWVLFDVNMLSQSVIIGPGRTPVKSVQKQSGRTVMIKHRKPVPQLLNESGTANATITWHKSGDVEQVLFVYRRFPISDYPRTREVANSKFRELVATAKL